MLFEKKVILILAAQSAALLASGFVAPAPFAGLVSTTQKSGPLFSDVVSAVSSTAEDEAAESVVEETAEPELPEATSEEESSEEPAAAPAAEKQRLTVFVGNLPFRKFTY